MTFRQLEKKPLIYMVVGSTCPTDAMLEKVETIVARIWYRHGQIITGDDHGVNAEVARQAIKWGVPCTIVGTTRRPTNGVSTSYLRLVVPRDASAQVREAVKRQYMIDTARRAVLVGIPALDAAFPIETC